MAVGHQKAEEYKENYLGRYTGPACRRCRRVGEKLFLKGDRCFTPKCAVDRRRTAPGERSMRRRRSSDHGIQLKEKQKARFMYGVMERQFSNYMDKAFNQSERVKLYNTNIENLKNEGHLYPCFETAEELSLKKKSLLSSGKPPIYDRSSLSLSKDEINEKIN